MNKSLGALLAICLAGLQFLAVLLVVFSSFVTSEQALIQHARSLLRDVGVNTIEHSKGFLSPAEGAAELAARLAQNRVIASDDTGALEQLLFQQLQIASQFAGIYYGGGDGDFVYVMRTPDGPGPFRSKIITRADDGSRQVELIWRDDNFNPVARRMDPEDTYDPRTRPWFIKASAEKATIWTDPYIFFSSQQPGITLAAPVIRESGEIHGVVGVDIEISMISHFLSRLNIGDHGRALIIHRDGDVIAHPNLELIKTRSDDGTLRFVNIAEFDDPIAREAFAPLLEGGQIRVLEETDAQFDYQGASYVSTVMPIISDKLPWTIAVYAPEDDFTSVIKHNRATNIWIAALVAIATGFVGLALANYIHKPVRAFAVRSALISQGEIDPNEPMPRTYRELERANDTLVREISARRATEDEYGQTFDLSTRGMAQIAPETGTFIRTNDRFRAITGYNAEEIAGMQFSDLRAPGGPEAAPFWLADVTEAGDHTMNQELLLRRKDGGSVWVAVNAIMIRDSAGRALHVVATVDDISEGREQAAQIVRLSRDLSHLARGHTMGQMAAGLAHELNQPLAAIAQNADTAILVLDEHPETGPELPEILQEIEKQSLRAGEIIRALRGFIRKDEGTRAPFDFAALVDQTLRLVQPEATDAGVTIRTDLPARLPEVTANRIQIAQIIVNLLRNAIEAMNEPGNNARQVTLGARAEGERLHVTVEDTGPGVPANVTLFTQFETTKPGGMGLGLSICRAIAETNGGALWQDGEPGEGARFHFTLPLTQAA